MTVLMPADTSFVTLIRQNCKDFSNQFWGSETRKEQGRFEFLNVFYQSNEESETGGFLRRDRRQQPGSAASWPFLWSSFHCISIAFQGGILCILKTISWTGMNRNTCLSAQLYSGPQVQTALLLPHHPSCHLQQALSSCTDTVSSPGAPSKKTCSMRNRKLAMLAWATLPTSYTTYTLIIVIPWADFRCCSAISSPSREHNTAASNITWACAKVAI